MPTLEMFKSKNRTHRFRKNQKVWIQYRYGNHSDIVFKWRGSGRYVRGKISNYDTNSFDFRYDLKEIDVTEKFYTFIQNFKRRECQ